MKVAALVINTVRNDRRVLREALELARAGHEVMIFGLLDANSHPRETLAPGCTVVRVPFRAAQQKLVSLFWLLCSAAAAMAAVLTLQLPMVSETRITTLVVSTLLGTLDLIMDHSDRAVLAGMALLGLAMSFKRFLGAYRRAMRYSAIESGTKYRPPSAWFRQVVKAFNILARHGVRYFSVYRQFDTQVARFRPDVIHCHDLPTLPMGARIKRKSGCLLVYDSHEIFEDTAANPPLVKWCLYRLQRRYSQDVDHFITVNDSLARLLNDRYPKLPPALVVKNAADPGFNGQVAAGDSRIHSALGLEPDCRVLLFQGGFSAQRGLEHLLEAAMRLEPEWKTVLMGWGSLEKRLHAKARRLDPGGKRIFFLPPVPPQELLAWTCGASLGIIPYEDSCLNHHFCTPNKLWEYPSAGVPILVSDLPELVKAVNEHGIGWVIPPPTNASAIVEAIGRISSRQLHAARTRCLEFARHDHCGIYGQRLTRLYDRISRAGAGRIRC